MILTILLAGVLNILNLISFQTTDDVKQLRTAYYEASINEDAAIAFNQQLENVGDENPLKLGYKAMSQLMLCNYGINPFTKLANFKNGKNTLEKALNLDKTNTELHYLRFTVQTNVPSFLGYSDNIETDKNILLVSLPTLKDEDLFDKIMAYLLSSEYCTQEEKKLLQKIKNGRSNISRQ